MKEFNSPYLRAKKRVNRIKKFYSHAVVYVVVNIAIIFVKLHFYDYFSDTIPGMDWYEVNWLGWEIISTPIIWGLFLLVHGVRVLLTPFSEKWEERQIQKYMQQEDHWSQEKHNSQ